MTGKKTIWRKDILAWALYDFANTMYSMNILSLYFASWLVIDLKYEDIHYSYAYSASMLLAAILMPAFGWYSDRRGGKIDQKRIVLLGIFTAGTIVSVLAFSVLPVAMIWVILILFALSNFFYEGGIVFYNALLDSVSTPQNAGTVSGFGVAMGYVGSIVGMILVLPFVSGNIFGLNIPWIEGAGKSGAFIPTAVLYAFFAIPIFILVREKQVEQPIPNAVSSDIKTAYKEIWTSIKSTEKYPGVLRFLIADYCFEDAIATVIIFMAVFSERVLGIRSDDLTLFLISSTVFAVIGSFIFGWLADRFAPKVVLGWIVAGWIAVLLVFAVNSIPIIFWICGPIVGMFLGGVWAVSRPLLMLLSPKEKLGEFFGLFSISGRAAAVCGPLLWGAVVYLFTPGRILGDSVATLLGLSVEESEKLPYRLAVLSLAMMMAVGLLIYRKVPRRQYQHEQ
ncbi:MAG: MFS transporter [Candidatus Zixiibacteriota bacterium]